MEIQSSEMLASLFQKQHDNRWNIARTSAKERIEKLKKLREAIVRRQDEFYEAIWEDFHKSRFEAWLCEVFPTIEEIDAAISNLNSWMEDKPASWVFFLPTSKSCLHYEPKGQVLIMAPWNYPFLLFVGPIISAIAAGNVIVAKPSHKTPKVSKFLSSLFEELFPDYEIAVAEGAGAALGDELLKLPFDHVFFTGSPKVGAHVGELASRIHAGITLELGGKSPSVILPHVDIKDAGEKLAWGKTLNCGQTCVAPDYVLCPEEKVMELAESIKVSVQKMFGDDDAARKASPDLVRIIDQRACSRHKELVNDALENGAQAVMSGEFDIDERYTPITILTGVTADMKVMESEIFGPILPIVSYKDLDSAIRFIQSRPKPLALYMFGNKDEEIQKVLQNTTSGSTCVNNTIIQIENLSVPFGGVGMSGTGSYHGFYGFKTFSHERNVMYQGSGNILKFFFAPFHNSRQQKSLRDKIQAISEKALRIIKGM